MWSLCSEWLEKVLATGLVSRKLRRVDTGSLLTYLAQVWLMNDCSPIVFVSISGRLTDRDMSLRETLGSDYGILVASRHEKLRRGWVRLYFEGDRYFCSVRLRSKKPSVVRIYRAGGGVVARAVLLTNWVGRDDDRFETDDR